MCPDAQLHSAFYDGEIPEPWNTKFAEHVHHCQKCSDTLASYTKITADLKSSAPDISPEFLNSSFDRLTTKMTKVISWERQRPVRKMQAPAGFVSIHTVKVAAAAVFIAAFLPMSFFLGKVSAERDMAHNASYVTNLAVQDHTKVAFPPHKSSSSITQPLTGISVAAEKQPVPVFEPGRGIVLQDSDREQSVPMIIIRLPAPDFSVFADSNDVPLNVRSAQQ